MKREDEHNLAALCHICNCVPIWGLIFCGAIWFSNREKSRYLVHQARQGMYFHGVLLFFSFAWLIIQLITKLVSEISGPLGGVLEKFNLFLIASGWIFFACICLWGAYKCWSGKPFRYPLIGQKSE